ncbi:MAG: PEGA domain-containing protein [Candidatus Omnitrophica bacterium]|nr:PEGA domain-containing protein [Candidatus Omnitrophota bacterium]
MCPIIIFDALGIVIRPQKPIMKTGVISLSTLPSNAKVHINGKLFNERTPTVIRNLKPGNYDITISISSYHTWHKVVPVIEEQATVLENIFLIPQVWAKRAITAFKFQKMLPIDERALLLIPQDNKTNGIYVYRWSTPALPINLNNNNMDENDKLSPLFNSSNQNLPENITDIITIEESTNLLLKLSNATVTENPAFIWVDPLSTPTEFSDISLLFTSQPENIFWSAEDNDNIFYTNSKDISRIDVKNKGIFPQIATNTKGFGLHGRQLYVVDTGDHFNKIDYRQPKREKLTGGLETLPKEFQETEQYRITVLNNTTLFLSQDGQLLWNGLPYKLIEKNCKGFIPLAEGKKLLVWTTSQIGIIDFAETRREGLFETGPTITWVINNGKNITQAFPVNHGSQIIFKDGDQVNLTDVDMICSREISMITSTQNRIFYSEKAGKLFYIDDKTQQLIIINILP